MSGCLLETRTPRAVRRHQFFDVVESRLCEVNPVLSEPDGGLFLLSWPQQPGVCLRKICAGFVDGALPALVNRRVQPVRLRLKHLDAVPTFSYLLVVAHADDSIRGAHAASQDRVSVPKNVGASATLLRADPFYSCRSAVSGSMRAARRAGR